MEIKNTIGVVSISHNHGNEIFFMCVEFHLSSMLYIHFEEACGSIYYGSKAVAQI